MKNFRLVLILLLTFAFTSCKNGKEQIGIISSSYYGPIFGDGCDIFIADKCHQEITSYILPESFDFKLQQFVPNAPLKDYFSYFGVKQYEIFSVTINK